MSVTVLAWAIRQTVGSGPRKAVLLALANRANEETGLCCPTMERVAEDTEFSVRTVEGAARELCEMGLLSRHRPRRKDGSLGTYRYQFPDAAWMRSPAVLPEAPAGGLPEAPAGQEPEVQNRTSTSVANAPSVDGRVSVLVVARDRPRSVNRKPTTETERDLAYQVLAAWNRIAGQDLRSEDWLSKIIMRLREYPEATLADHALIIETALANPWWHGPASPSVVYGNGAQFERSIAQVRSSQTVSEEIKTALEGMRRSRERRRAG